MNAAIFQMLFAVSHKVANTQRKQKIGCVYINSRPIIAKKY